MRSTTLAGLAAAALIMTTVPSEAAWNGYFNRVVEFSFSPQASSRPTEEPTAERSRDSAVQPSSSRRRTTSNTR